ncbi:MAG: Fe-S cluster assembly protein SufD [Bacteroidetes bacterium]|nr:Fe-S cluster assembly protein SufD [Bacteroidota bacterium]
MTTIVSNTDLKEKFSKAFEEAQGLKSQLHKEAFDAFQNMGLPGTKTEEYRFTPIARLLEKNFNLDEIEPVPSGINSVKDFLIPDLDATVLVFLNGFFSETLSSSINNIDGLKISKLESALASGEAADYFQKLLKPSDDPFTALNSAFWQDGIFIHVPPHTKVEKPILILHINDVVDRQSIAHTRLLLVVGEGSELTLIEKSNSTGDHSIFHTFAEEIAVKENATLNYIKIQNDDGKLHQVANSLIHQSAQSILNTFTLTLSGALIRNNFNIAIDGEFCESHFHGLYLLNGSTLADNHTVVDHLKPNSHSNELYKGVLDGNSKGIFNGKIFVRPHAQKTNAFQSNRNILLTDTATINTKPQLEIWADDVKCSHGCTTGQLDEEALFYLRSRGIPLENAKAMLLYAFAAETLEVIKKTELKNYLDQRISDRLAKF